MQPKVYSLDEHKIPHDKINRHAYYVIEKLRQEGFIAYLVGGNVRDLLLHLNPKDIDIATSAKPEEVKKLFRNCILIGRRFRLAHIRFGKTVLEVATFRSGDTEESTLIVRDNIWGSPEEDVLRRDFTINGLFYNPETQTIIDYVEGFPDIEKKILRAIGKPEVRFSQDPVRMIRLLKFKARFDLEIEAQTYDALIECKKEITKSSPARILEELFRMTESGFSKPFFELLFTHGFLQLLLPNLINQENPTAFYPYLEIVDSSIQKKQVLLDRAVLFSCLLFPLFEKKIKTLTYPHLGRIADEARKLIDKVFLPFFPISRKIKITMISILLNQYRFLPISRIPRIPKDPFFSLALDFFELRCHLDPSLFKTFTLWKETFVDFSHPRKKSPSHEA